MSDQSCTWSSDWSSSRPFHRPTWLFLGLLARCAYATRLSPCRSQKGRHGLDIDSRLALPQSHALKQPCEKVFATCPWSRRPQRAPADRPVKLYIHEPGQSHKRPRKAIATASGISRDMQLSSGYVQQLLPKCRNNLPDHNLPSSTHGPEPRQIRYKQAASAAKAHTELRECFVLEVQVRTSDAHLVPR